MEFSLLISAQNEKLYDMLEMKSIEAMMLRKAYHSDKKNMNVDDFFKRPTDEETERKTIANMKKTMEEQQEWLNRFQFGGGGTDG